MYRVITTAELLRIGITKRGIVQALTCCLRRSARGRFNVIGTCPNQEHLPIWKSIEEKYALATPEFGDHRDREERMKVLIRARAEKVSEHLMASLQDERKETFSHLSAALIHGLPIVARPHDRVEVYRVTVPQKHRHLRVRSAELPPEHVVVIGLYRVTSLDRTLIDIALLYEAATSVAMLDHALSTGATTSDRLRSMLEARPDAQAQRRASVALQLADARRESPGESVTAVRLFEYGISGFVPQVEFRDQSGRVHARVDLCHEASQTIVEFDGITKYIENSPDTRQAIEKEKQRDAWLSARGYRVIHLLWRDLFSASAFEDIKRIVAERMQSIHAATPASRHSQM